MPEQFAPSAADLQKIGVAAYPTPGQAFALEADGTLPPAVNQIISGYQISYKETSSGTTVTASVESSPTTILTMDPVYFDGRTTVLLGFQSQALTVTGGGTVNRAFVLNFWDGTTDLGRVAQIADPTGTGTAVCPANVDRRIQPAQGYHTYSTRGWINGNTGSGSILAGVGGAGTQSPAFMRLIRAA